MNYQTMADIFRGLAQSGTWGCFDEFNRISIEVLSVIATQVKTVQDCLKKYAIPANRDPEFQHLPPGLPPVKVGNFMFEGTFEMRLRVCESCFLCRRSDLPHTNLWFLHHNESWLCRTHRAA